MAEGNGNTSRHDEDSLAGYSERIAQVRAAVEDAFTEAADALIGGGERLAHLTRALEAFSKGLAGLRASDVSGATEELTQRTNDLASLQRHEAECLTALNVSLDRATPKLLQLSDVVRTIEYSASTARVVEVAMTSKGGIGFSDVIRVLALKGREAYTGLSTHHSKLLLQTAELRKDQADFSRRHLSRVRHVASTLTGLVDQLDDRIAASTRASADNACVVERVSHRMTKGISALQIGDSFRQRLEHAEAALALHADVDQAPQTRDLILRIVSAQLEGAGSALGSELLTLRRELDGIARDTDRLAENSDLTATGETDGIWKLLWDLQAHCSNGLAMLYASQAQRRTLDRQVATLIRTIKEMEGAIGLLREVDTEMRLASLNVLLRSMRFEGRRGPIHTIATSLGELTDECSDLQNRVLDELRAIRDVATAMRSDRQSNLASEIGALAERFNGLNDVLSLSDEVRNELAGFQDFGRRAVADFVRCGEMMEEQTRAAAAIMAVSEDIAALTGSQDPYDFCQDHDALAAAAQLRTTYSVPEERKIHDAMCPGSPEPGTDDPDPQSDMEDELEWF